MKASNQRKTLAQGQMALILQEMPILQPWLSGAPEVPVFGRKQFLPFHDCLTMSGMGMGIGMAVCSKMVSLQSRIRDKLP